MKNAICLQALIVAISLIACSGCQTGDRDPHDRNAVFGTVTLDSRPVGKGAITFYPIEQGPVVSGAIIRDGIYAIDRKQGLVAGVYKVSITSAAISMDETTDPQELMAHPPQARELIPSKYNSQTELTCEVRPDSKNEFPFTLVTK